MYVGCGCVDVGVDVDVPSVEAGVDMELGLLHSAEGGASSDAVVDNIVVFGGTCGTEFACICRGNQRYATSSAMTSAGEAPDNNKGRLFLAEAADAFAPGYATNAELTCLC